MIKLVDFEKLKQDVSNLLEDLNIDLKDPGFIDTPKRVATFYKDFIFREAPEIRVFPSESTNLVELNNYSTWGLCGHHLLPVKYTISISYIPQGKVFGISKLPRIADYMLKSLPLQEDLPKLIVDYIAKTLDITSCACIVEGMHLCMVMRGVKAAECTLTTNYAIGECKKWQS